MINTLTGNPLTQEQIEGKKLAPFYDQKPVARVYWTLAVSYGHKTRNVYKHQDFRSISEAKEFETERNADSKCTDVRIVW